MANYFQQRISRRSVTAAGAGVAAGLLAVRGVRASAPAGTPEAGAATPVGGVSPLGYVTMRMRPLDDPAFRDDMNARVIDEFLPKIKALEGFDGYLVGDVIDFPNLTFGVTVLQDTEDQARSDEVAKSFVFESDIDKHIIIEETRQWAGDLLIVGRPADAARSPAASPAAANGAGSYVTARLYTSRPKTDPREFVPEAITGFLPIVMGLPGFIGYLWFPVAGGFVSLSLYDTQAAAIASTGAAKVWVAEHLAAYTDGNPEVINATVAYADMPIFQV